MELLYLHTFPITNKEDLERATALIDELWDSEPGTPEHELLDAMATLVDEYEDRNSNL